MSATLPELTKNIQDRSSADTLLLESSPSLYSLERAQFAWQVLAGTVSSAQLKLTDNANQANASLQQLKDLDKVWQTTLHTAKPGGAPPEVITRIQSVLTTIDQTAKNALSVQAQILALQTKLSDENSAINSGLENIAKAQVVARAKLLEQDHPPLWLDSTASDQNGIISQENNSIVFQGQTVRSYLAERIDVVWIHILVWIFMIFALHWVRRSVPKGSCGGRAPHAGGHRQPLCHYRLFLALSAGSTVALLYDRRDCGHSHRHHSQTFGGAGAFPHSLRDCPRLFRRSISKHSDAYGNCLPIYFCL